MSGDGSKHCHLGESPKEGLCITPSLHHSAYVLAAAPLSLRHAARFPVARPNCAVPVTQLHCTAVLDHTPVCPDYCAVTGGHTTPVHALPCMVFIHAEAAVAQPSSHPCFGTVSFAMLRCQEKLHRALKAVPATSAQVAHTRSIHACLMGGLAACLHSPFTTECSPALCAPL